MAIIYVMETKKNYTYNEIINALLHNNEVNYFLEYIKANEFEDDDLVGLKFFLENNNYNITLLKTFIEPPELNLKVVTKNKTYNYYKIAASIILILSVSFLIKISLPNKKSSINNYWIDDSGFKIWMNVSNKSNGLHNGMSYYRAENYKFALEQFAGVIQNDTAIYYSGICFIKLNELDSATYYLKQLSPQSVYKNKSVFYLSLCYIFNNNIKSGLELLNNTVFIEHDFEEAKKIIIKDFKNN